MPVEGIESYGVSSSYYSPDVIGKDEFLRLLTIQLRYQDPTAPLENKEFLAQLAQFSALEQLLNVNGNLQANFLMMQSLNNSVVASFIGKKVKASGNEVYLNEEGDVSINYALDGSAKVTVKIYDESGNLVRTLNSDWQTEGDNELIWDGKNSAGTRVAEGKYSFEIEAVGADGNEVGATPFIEGKVTGVRFVNGAAVLLLDGLEIYLSDILEVLEGGD